MEPDVFVMPFGIKEAEAARQAVEQKKLNLFPNKQKNAQNCRDPFTHDQNVNRFCSDGSRRGECRGCH